MIVKHPPIGVCKRSLRIGNVVSDLLQDPLEHLPAARSKRSQLQPLFQIAKFARQCIGGLLASIEQLPVLQPQALFLPCVGIEILLDRLDNFRSKTGQIIHFVEIVTKVRVWNW